MKTSDYPDSYYSRTLRERREYAPLEGGIDVETLVIGGGLAGCATALDLAERGHRVALIEAARIGWGASGRNGGFASDGFPGGYPKLVRRVGIDRALEFHALVRMGQALLRKRIEQYGIACGPIQDGALRCNIVGRGDDLIELREFMAVNFATDYEHWPRERVIESLSTERYGDALFNPLTYSVHPLDLNCGLARAAAARGAQLFEGSPAVALSLAGDRQEVRTPRGRIRAERVVIACGGYIEGLQRSISAATIPIATFVMTTEPLGEQLKKAIRVPYAIFDNQVATNYYRPLFDTRILWGGRVLAWQPSAARIAELLKRDMIAFYPALRDARVDLAWGGMMPFTRHKLPVIGQIEPNVWYATGFGGLGVTLTTTAGRLIAAAITAGDEQWRLFEAFGLPYAGGKLGKIPAQLVYWRHQLAARFGYA